MDLTALRKAVSIVWISVPIYSPILVPAQLGYGAELRGFSTMLLGIHTLQRLTKCAKANSVGHFGLGLLYLLLLRPRRCLAAKPYLRILVSVCKLSFSCGLYLQSMLDMHSFLHLA